jgi:hypothetical protein
MNLYGISSFISGIGNGTVHTLVAREAFIDWLGLETPRYHCMRIVKIANEECFNDSEFIR